MVQVASVRAGTSLIATADITASKVVSVAALWDGEEPSRTQEAKTKPRLGLGCDFGHAQSLSRFIIRCFNQPINFF
jgi:hypothetical protein